MMTKAISNLDGIRDVREALDQIVFSYKEGLEPGSSLENLTSLEEWQGVRLRGYWDPTKPSTRKTAAFWLTSPLSTETEPYFPSELSINSLLWTVHLTAVPKSLALSQTAHL